MRRVDQAWRFLVLRCYDHWDFPKGGLEPGESPLAAALRETEEESGITDLEFLWGEDFRETSPYSRPPKVARYYLARTRCKAVTLPVSPKLGRPEHDEWRWVDERQAARLLPPRLQPILSWALTVLAGGA